MAKNPRSDWGEVKRIIVVKVVHDPLTLMIAINPATDLPFKTDECRSQYYAVFNPAEEVFHKAIYAPYIAIKFCTKLTFAMYTLLSIAQSGGSHHVGCGHAV